VRDAGGDGRASTWIGSLPDVADADLSVYAQSKLALMQFSALLRHRLRREGDAPAVRVADAHPGLVWTPLLRDHLGARAAGALARTRLAGLLYKSATEGARAVVAALDLDADAVAGTVGGTAPLYLVNGRPGGRASPESASLADAARLWDRVIAPAVRGAVRLPPEWGEKSEAK